MATRLGRKFRVLRLRRGWRQIDLARKARVSHGLVSLIERGHIPAVSLAVLHRIADALEARLVVDLQWRGAELDALLDARHASLVEWLASLLRRYGWQVRPEVSFNHYGDRGRYDLLAFHGETRTLLAVEVKTALGDLQDLLGRLDIKIRVAGRTATSLGWRASNTVPLLLLAEDSRTRRTLRDHPALFARFGLRGLRALSWLRNPSLGVPVLSGLLVFRALSGANQAQVIAGRRVKRPPGANQAAD